MKELKELNKWREVLSSWIGWLNKVKMSFLSRFIYEFAPIPVKFPGRFVVGMESLCWIIYGKTEKNIENKFEKL